MGREDPSSHDLSSPSLSDREPHWTFDSEGFITIPSPIPVFPKPLALSYRNYYTHYASYKVRDAPWEPSMQDYMVQQPRAEVGSFLVGDLLRYYFPVPGYKVKRMEFVEKGGLLEGVGEQGTQHFVVFKEMNPLLATQGDGVERKDTKMLKDSRMEVVAIVVVVTEAEFVQEPPTQLSIAKQHLRANGILQVEYFKVSHAPVVLLTGSPNPLRPLWKFYVFDSKVETKGVLVSWNGETEDGMEGLDDNAVSLAPENAHLADKMFKACVRVATGVKAVIATPATAVTNASAMEQETNVTPKIASTPLADITESYTRSVKMNNSGASSESKTIKVSSREKKAGVRNATDVVGYGHAMRYG